ERQPSVCRAMLVAIDNDQQEKTRPREHRSGSVKPIRDYELGGQQAGRPRHLSNETPLPAALSLSHGMELRMHENSNSAPAPVAQAPEPDTNHRAPDVASFIARHGVTVCPPGATTPKLKKPASAKRRRLHKDCWMRRRARWRRKSKEELDAWVKG